MATNDQRLHPAPAAGATAGALDEVTAADPPGNAGGRRWMLPRLSSSTAWIEMLGLTAVALVLGYLADPADPLHTKSQFPWTWFAPVLIALRYGALFGLASAAILIGAWYALTPNSLSIDLPKLQVLGGLLLTMVCGEFSAAWRLRLRRTTELSSYLDDRVERVTRQLYLLRLSHDRLEQELLARPTTMRDALAQLRARFSSSGAPGGRELQGAEAFLQFLAQHCQLEVAAIYASDGESPPAFGRVARLGAAPELLSGDPLLQHVLDTGELAHVQTEGLDRNLPTQYLVMCPIQTSDKRLLGVAAVSRLPFFALNQDQLQLMRVLCGAYADTVAFNPEIERVRAALPDVSDEFADEFVRLVRVERDSSIASHLVVMIFGDSSVAPDAHQLVLRQRRAPDVVWTPAPLAGTNERAVFVNLLPISGSATVEGYLVRTEAALRENFGLGLQELHIRTYTIPLSDADPIAALVRALGRRSGQTPPGMVRVAPLGRGS